MAMIGSFPAGLTPRPIQVDLVARIEESIKSGYEKIIVSAPTGVGKSPIAVNLSLHYGGSFIVTASKQLQDQYSKEFEMLRPVKGKSNFACMKIMEQNGVAKKELARAMELRMTCNKGQCQEKRDGKTYNCKYKPAIEDFESGSFEGTVCPYYDQKYTALISPHSLWNYYAYFQIMKYNKKTFAKYLDRPVAIFDEAHKIEDQILQFIGIAINRRDAEECGIDTDSYDLSDIDLITALLDDMAGHYSKKISDIQQSPGFEENPDYDLLNRLDAGYTRYAAASAEISSNKDNFVINLPRNPQYSLADVRPLDISKYVQKFFDAPVQVFMSATINRNSFCETTGIAPSDVAIVDAPVSPFPLENRRIEFLNVRSLGYRSSLADELAVIGRIDELLCAHAGQRGLVLTSSRARCRQIRDNLSESNRKRIRICHAGEGAMTPDEIIAEHSCDPGGVLLSSSLWEGVDLKDDMSRFQIISKIPYPNFSDKRVALKMKKYPLWYASQTLTKLLQGFGRSIRSQDDWARTYVLDSMVQHLIQRSWDLIPQAYRDTLGGADTQAYTRP